MLLFQIDKHEPKNCAILIHIVPQLRTFPVCFQSLHRFMQAKDLSVEESEPEEASMVGRSNPAYLAHLHLPSTEFLLWDTSGHLYVQIGCIVASQFRSNHDFTTILRLSGVFCHDIWIHMDDYG